MEVVKRVLSFWYDEENPDLAADGEFRAAWFKKDGAFDKTIRENFEVDVTAAAKGEYDELRKTVEGVLTLVILLDQFPRNLYRGSPQAFATDSLAREIVKAAIESSFDAELGKTRRIFLYLPFEHSENLEDQDMAVRLFKALNHKESYAYALEHYYVISRFSRFPGRNIALGRDSSQEELDFLKRFGAF